MNPSPTEPLTSSTNPLPFTGTTSEDTFTTSTNPIQLYTKTWVPAAPSTIHVIFLHGFSDHINAYYNFFPILASPPYNITVHGFDQRGWGRSVSHKPQRGLTGGTEQVLADIRDFHAHVSRLLREQYSGSDSEKSIDDVQLFLGGHSMGGAEALTYTLTRPPQPDKGKFLPITGLILEAPHISLPPTSQPSALLLWSGRLASRFLPNMQMLQRLAPEYVSRDPAIVKQWTADPLCHDTGTLAGLAGLLDRATNLDTLSLSPAGSHMHRDLLDETLIGPVFWAHGTQDKICSFDASQRLFRRLTEQQARENSGNNQTDARPRLDEFKTYSGHYHKLHCEPDGDGERFARDVGDWILKLAGRRRTDISLSTSASTGPTADLAPSASRDHIENEEQSKSKL